MADDETAALNQARHTAWTNGKYHSDRESFFDFWDKWTTFGVLATGAVAFFEMFGESAQKAGAGVLALFALAQLVFALSSKARDHSQFKQRYFELAARLESKELSARDASAEMLRISGEEPPPYCAVHALAENWATKALFGPEKESPCNVRTFRKLTRNWWRWEGTDFGCR